jgi:hypothetical protein
MSQPSIIVYASTDVDKIPMLDTDNAFTGTNTFSEGATETFTTADGKTVTVVAGLITSISGPSASQSPSGSSSPSGSLSPSSSESKSNSPSASSSPSTPP